MNTYKREIYYTEGDWSVRWYENNGIVQLCHKHDSGTTYIIPFGYSRDHDYRCHECEKKAPEGSQIVWRFLNWDRFAK